MVFDFHVPEGERLPREVALEVRDAAGALAFQQDECRTQSHGDLEYLMAVSALPFGRFTCSARSTEGWSATATLEVVPGSEVQQRAPISLVRER